MVRHARAGEVLKLLDEREVTLDPGFLLVTDADRPVALGGVMGGWDTRVTGTTTRVFFEAAHWIPGAIIGLIILHLHLVIRLGVTPNPWTRNAAGEGTVVAKPAEGREGLLRHGGMSRIFAAAYAPSTLGSFLRAFTSAMSVSSTRSPPGSSAGRPNRAARNRGQGWPQATRRARP